MALSWNEIKDRALQFTKEWAEEERESAESKSFWDAFFNVLGITRRRVASYEEYVKMLGKEYGFIDLFWKGTLLVEHKSKGKKLDSAYIQAMDYFIGLKEHELPKYVMVSDFENFRLYDLDEGTQEDFNIKDFYKKVKLFGFIAGYQKRSFKEEDPVNVKAAELLGKLHDKLEEDGYGGHELEVFLVRILFCLFADDTSIFEKDTFKEYIEQRTSEDGSDLGDKLSHFFQVLNKPKEKRSNKLDEHLAEFPYINGKLFEEILSIPSFDKEMREVLLQCSSLDWGKISPAIFGSMFQSVMKPEERRNLGAHYTSEQNILKLIKPLFLDDLWDDFSKCKGNIRKLDGLHEKLTKLKFLDPACGCGNFLIISYRELRILELEIIKEIHKKSQVIHNVESIIGLDVDQFYGIEYEEWPARIAEVAMWLMDHQMNMMVSETFGEYFTRLPLRKSATIVNGNALRIDWNDIVAKDELSYILGNPPFYGKQYQTKEQKEDMKLIFQGVKGYGVLDYVTAWYIKAAQYIQNTNIKVAFVSTNSIAQGEQTGILWNELFDIYNIHILFAHRTFKWNNEARGKAAVHVIIIGFANFDTNDKRIYEYEDIRGEPHEIKAKNINPYLVDAPNVTITKRRNPICDVQHISFGSMPNDGGNFLFSDEEKAEFVEKEPEAVKYFRPLLSARQYLNGENRWCLWLKNISPKELRILPYIKERVERVKELREKSTRKNTRELANKPNEFGENRQPREEYILIPRHSSENRKYIPFGFFDPYYVASDSCLAIDNANLYEFGVLESMMHMTWIKYICGRIKSDYRYSNELVYNNFPWPDKPIEKNAKKVKEKAELVIKIREEYPDCSLADLYDPIAMPAPLAKAHRELDKAVDLCYRAQPFKDEMGRIEFLFNLYEKYVFPLTKK
ncbi:class I SAM-dependent DNA methyltransferase [bacterium]|nr:MAG: class I SAM-dependent DNA methyltransferase [bacterium]